MANGRQWLHAEQSGQEELAEMIFRRVIADMPSIQPGPQFLDRTVRAALQTRTRCRVLRPVALISAASLISIGGLGAIYTLAAPAAALAARVAIIFSHGLVWLLTSASEDARWWWLIERIGGAARAAIATPSTAASIAAIETLALLAIYGFRQLLAEDLERQDSR